MLELIPFTEADVDRLLKAPEDSSSWSEVVMSILAPEWAASKETR